MSLQNDANSSALLTAALEKLLYLETRLEAAEAAREEAARECDRQRIAAQAARQALSEWQKRATDAEITAEGAEREATLLRDSLHRSRQPQVPTPTDSELAEQLREAQERLARYDREREMWLDRMVVLGRLHHQGDDLDLGSFISELRAELLALRRGETERRGATVADRPRPPDPAQILNEAPSGPPVLDADALLKSARLPRPERTLATICGRDLKSAAASVRRRAVERLTESSIGVLNPIAITMLAAEPDAHVRVALVKLLESTGGETADLALAKALTDTDPRVRAAALEALARRQAVSFDQALSDADPAVRRRALTLLPRSPHAVDLLTEALSDPEASVRHVAALALTRQSGTEAEALLQVAAQSLDPEVNAVAREALRRRNQTPPPAPELSPVVAEPAPLEEPPAAAAVETPAIDLQEEPAPPQVQVSYEVDERIAEEIRTSLRGRTLEELATRLEVALDEAQAAAGRLVEAGTLVWRGRKLYLA